MELPAGWDPYEELDLPRDATTEEVKVSFRELARKHHPDKAHGGGRDDGGERFKRARKAYEILSDAASRTLFDCQHKIASKELANILEVDIDDMEYNETAETFGYGCRCSGSYSISTAQLDEGFDTVCCTSCSHCIHVLYEIDPEREG